MAQRIRIRRKVRRGSPRLRRAGGVVAPAARGEARRGQVPAGGLTIGGVQDPAEKAADRTADRVMRMTAPAPVVHRMCDECAEDEKKAKRQPAGEEEDKTAARQAEENEEEVQAKAVPGTTPVAPGTASAPASSGQATAIGGLGAGRPLASAERAFFEPRFGADLSPVRVHEDGAADRASRAISARAFALGHDVAFARGAYAPGTSDGRRLMAHELAHVVGSGGRARRRVSRKPEIQKADHATSKDFKAVPDKEEPRIKAALAIIEQVSKNAKCEAYFKSKCSGGKEDELQQAIDNAKIFRIAGSGLQFGSSLTRSDPADPRTIAYTPYVFRVGRWQLAASLLHEMFHTCIIGTIPDEEIVDEKGIQECGFFTPWIHWITPRAGSVGDEIGVIAHRVGSAPDARHKLFLGGTEIATFERWNFAGSGLDIGFKIPAGAASGDIFFENNGVQSNRVKFTVTP